ncbi:MAG: hypothetical protein HN509_06005 [Halobacteriovoraceae bacterium]|jgi:hypothetical protein|nr:hypothetical protein [Halobacteriovoraceae bacterium]MBT5095019.1 hypothetical protein [Halobacteriovoraceae bacterium]
MESAISLIKQNHLGLSLASLSIRELLFVKAAPGNIYALENGNYKIVLKKKAVINKTVLKELLANSQYYLFMDSLTREQLKKTHQDNLRMATRSLSVGDLTENALYAANLLTINMGYLYERPIDDELLKLQHQCAQNLANFLLEIPELHHDIYQQYIKQKHHFVFAQPFLSSLFVLGALKQSHFFTDKDVEALFVTSYFKDIGMSSIPTDKYDQEELDEQEKKLLAQHAKHSVSILKNRLALTPAHLTIIENHHFFSLMTQGLDLDSVSKDVVFGAETMIISVMDIISAMITGRPFRNANTLFEALELVKIIMSDQYPQEFKLVVSYFRNFFFNKR